MFGILLLLLFLLGNITTRLHRLFVILHILWKKLVLKMERHHYDHNVV